ncbi:MAG: MFS transporter [Planctomycetota bacterium]
MTEHTSTTTSPIRSELMAAAPGAETASVITDQVAATQQPVVVSVLAALSVSHLLNDTIQSVVVAMYPMLKESFRLSYGDIGLITLVSSLTASVLQPLVGLYTDRRPQPYALCVGMTAMLIGLVLMAVATSLAWLLVASALIGIGSSVFHPEASRVARLVSGGRHGLAQSVFQVGGNLGSSLGPLCAVIIIIPRGQSALGWFSLAALVGIVVLAFVGKWYGRHLHMVRSLPRPAVAPVATIPTRKAVVALAILGLLIFSKYFYLVSLTNYYIFFLIDRFQLSEQAGQIYLFAFLFAVAAGTIVGGPIGDRIGRRRVIIISILGVAPFTLLLPYVNLFWTCALSLVVGVVLASAFSAILVYAQELLPGRVGLVSGLFFGFAFGMAGIGAAVLGHLADYTSIGLVYKVCAFLPLLGLFALFLPDLGRSHRATERQSPELSKL